MCVFLRRLNARKTQMEDKANIEYLKVILFLLLVSSSVAAAAADDDDANAMAELAAWLPPAPPKWAPDLSSHYCTWGEGVRCADDSRRVISLYLIDVHLSGLLPPLFPYLPMLSALRLVNNSLSGSLPSLTNLPSLKILLLNQNKFTNITPEFFSGLSSRLLYFEIDDNPFLNPWKIPIQLARFTGMAGFFAQNANVVGHIPDVFSSCTVQRLRLSYNNLSGPLPSSFGRSQIKELSITRAGLTGTVDVLSSMFYLEIAHLEGNKFTGPIPKISIQTNLKELYLDDNQLTGVVPESLDGLQVVSLSRNKLQGPYPAKLNDTVEAYLNGNNFCTGNGEPCDPQVTTLLEIVSAFFYPLKLSVPWASNDACNDWSFVTCNLKHEIATLDFRKQQLTGTISPSFANLTALQYLYLNDNNLMGVIPESLSKLPHLAVLDVSNNNISGEIPKFSSSVKVVTAGNALLGKNKSFGSPDEGGHQSSAKTSGERGLRTITIIALLLIWAAAGAVCLYWLWVKVAKVKGQKPKHGALYTDVYSRFTISEVFNKDKNQAVQLFTFEQLATATSNFSATNELGRGGFGSVFKGILDTQEIAVKRLSRASAQGPKEFVNEALVMSKLQHRNLVRLLGVCIDREEKVLVYEYMPNKSLDAFLFDTEKKRLLGWRNRFNIIVGISRGLQYLHKDSRMLIIHRDLKASNILLDEELNPKISDFGLAKVFDCSIDQANTRRVVGTYGYMPPEYAMEGRFSEKSDVFSFGVLILEVISGRRNASIGYNEHSLSLLEHAWKLWNDENISALLDPVISDSCIYEEIYRCTHVGLLCTQQSVTERPSISTVTLMLTSELDNLLPPKQPAFIEWYAYASHSHSTMSISQVLMVDGQ